MAQPRYKHRQPSWLQHALSNFITMRNSAERQEQQGRLCCMPVMIVVSTRTSTVTEEDTGWLTHRNARFEDLHLRPLSDDEAERAVLQVVQRASGQSEALPALPQPAKQLLKLLAGNPHPIAWSLSALSGQKDLRLE